MKVSIYNAVSIDGYIATSNHDASWVQPEDWAIFAKKVKDSKVIVMGRKTYETSGDDFPYDCELNIVVTKRQELIEANKDKEGVLFTNKQPQEIINEVKSLGYDELLIIGGGILNAAFVAAGLVDEIIVDIHPILLGSGVKLVEEPNLNIKLDKISIAEHPGNLTQIIYKIIK